MTIRFATPEDVPAILGLIKDLADYEQLLHEVEANEERLHAHLFGDRPYVEVLMAEEDGELAGFALFFHNYSTFLAKPGIYLEDLFVKPTFRGKGIGKALLVRLAQLTVERDCGRLEWSVLDWNEPSIQFYKAQGAKAMDEWTVYRVTGDKLSRLAAGEPVALF
ncbi:GNAT family N-acetyltransferase [bacterium]|nr:GNAT family N-acetyltransferase [bacterium]